MATDYIPRFLDSVLDDLLAGFPAVLLTGPRATGKTTTAARFSRSEVRLDRPQEAAVVAADPDAALRGHAAPVLIDEWQVVPSVLGAVKRAVDSNGRAGQFVITGSVCADLSADAWPGTGRLVRLAMFGITTRERIGDVARPGLIDRIVAAGPESLVQPRSTPDLRGYVGELLVGGFPQALALASSRREVWLECYLEQVVTRDVPVVDQRRDAVRLRRYLDALAVNSAGAVDDATLVRAAGVDRRTAIAYERLLSGLSLLDTLPAWWTNRLKRLTQRPKRMLTDAALAAAALRVGEEAVMRDADVLGRLLETFVVAQLRAELAASRTKPRLHHLRTESGRQEVDVIAELPGSRIIGIEIKATSAPTRRAARHLMWLRDELGDGFVGGVLLHTGSRAFVLEERIVAAPISTLWS